MMKRVLVTGGSRGLGLAICRRLLASGYHVVTAARRMSDELELLKEVAGAQLEFHPVDFACVDSVSEFARRIRTLDGFDGFVANAAIGVNGLLTLTPEMTVLWCVQVNLTAPILLAREVIKGMLDRGGSLVFVASTAARTGMAGLTVYSATKGGLVSFSRAVAREYGARGIRSNAILPGFIESDMTRELDRKTRERIEQRTALGRLGDVADIVGSVRFLLSDDARFITGTELVVDGGCAH